MYFAYEYFEGIRYQQILLLSIIIKIVKKYNIDFQDQKLSVSELKKKSHNVYDAVSELVFGPELQI